ncbi:flagellar biogenesis protein FliO [Bartonella fuyuanensis]|uniref:Flagellar biogenesis protein FliO n=1 Tax=Bartonella fuyuanensis TaxID=1460968 RepID=A0A840DXD4_9HYPH|nr:flagellar biosynthetic protein FliO [Bartonella fuyuanensis]MBB4076182.1 flagellar biogenesis protein FliO [Bartonella fuyuanensis]
MYIWLSNQIGLSAANIIISFLLFIITIAAITIVIVFLRRLNTARFRVNREKSPSRLAVCETISIDRIRHLVLVRCDNKEHLLLIGGLTDVVVESDITSTPKMQKRETSLHSSPLLPEKNKRLDKNSLSFTNQSVRDSEITAEIEGRQEPSLFIPTPQK